VVPLNALDGGALTDLGAVLEQYMRQSEQLDAKLILAANDEIAAGLLIQRMPIEGEANLAGTDRSASTEMDVAEQYNRIAHLAATLTPEELLTLDAQTILHRLFWEEDLRYFEPSTGASGPKFACSCSRERVATMLRGLGKPEIDSIVAEQGQVEIGCDFCGQHYQFDPIDAAELFRDGAEVAPGSSRLQ